MVWWQIVLIVIVSYFMGNISFSRFLARTKKQDITKLGSGNAGSTNVLRNFGFKYGVLNLVLDILKGFVPSFLAYKILSKIEHDKAYSNITLESVLNNNEASSASFVRALVYGVLERKITLDYYLSKLLTQPIKKLNPNVLTILRLGAYQILYMDKVPVSAAVNECVKLSRKSKCGYASGLINSVLRKLSTTNVFIEKTNNKIYDLSIEYSCPETLVKQFVDDYGYTYILATEVIKCKFLAFGCAAY